MRASVWGAGDVRPDSAGTKAAVAHLVLLPDTVEVLALLNFDGILQHGGTEQGVLNDAMKCAWVFNSDMRIVQVLKAGQDAWCPHPHI